MFETLFMFGGRLNRLQYFFTGLIVSLIGGVIIGVAVMSMAKRGLSVGAIVSLAILGLPFLWMSVSMQAARIRDIGLSPLPVIGGLMIFYGMAHFAKTATTGVEMTLLFSGLAIVVQLIHGLFLLFMPGDSFSRNSPPPSFDGTPEDGRHTRTAWDEIPIPARQAPARYIEPEPVRAARPPQAHGKPAFGRRGM